MRRNDPEASVLCAQPLLPAPPAQVIEALEPLLIGERIVRIDAVIAQRTRGVVAVLEAVDDPRNVSAVLRSAEAFGVQEVHLVRGPQEFLASKLITQGAHRWLDLIWHAGPEACVAALRARGFRVYVATMDGASTPEELPSMGNLAMVFGNEQDGVSSELAALADGRYTIPMRGFAQSLNVSVAAGITLQAATRGRAFGLEPADVEALRARFMFQSVPRAAEVVAEHIKRRLG